MQETTEKIDNIVRSERLTIPLYNHNGLETSLSIESEEPEIVSILVNGKYVGGCDMENLLALCKRALELWEGEA